MIFVPRNEEERIFLPNPSPGPSTLAGEGPNPAPAGTDRSGKGSKRMGIPCGETIRSAYRKKTNTSRQPRTRPRYPGGHMPGEGTFWQGCSKSSQCLNFCSILSRGKTDAKASHSEKWVFLHRSRKSGSPRRSGYFMLLECAVKWGRPGAIKWSKKPVINPRRE